MSEPTYRIESARDRKARRGHITYDDVYGHVCTCTETLEYEDCEGHPAGEFDPMGVSTYCDGTCTAPFAVYEPTVEVNRTVEPTQSGSYLYTCTRCGANGWSGL